MQKRPWEISDLLALRDGEPHPAGLDIEDPDVTSQLQRLKQLKADLNTLPDVPLDDGVWAQLPTAPPRRQSVWLRFPLATAASVFLASVVGMYVLFGTSTADRAGFETQNEYATTMPMDTNGLQLATLMRQSRDLEQRLYGPNPLSLASDSRNQSMAVDATPSPAEQVLLFRLADVDEQIAGLYEAERMDTVQRQMLWSQRVNLLQSLVAVRGGSDPRMFEQVRSM